MNPVFRVVGVLGWLAFITVAVLQGGCGIAPEVKAPSARDAYKATLAACLACSVPGAPAFVAEGCDELAPVCDALAGVCTDAGAAGARN